jgi:SMODS and SLOG-associating 2TM effector domain family 5
MMTDTDQNSSIIEEAAKRSEDVDKYYAQFLSKLWVTKGCRFQANHRLARKNQAAILTVSLLSIYVIAGSLVTLVAPVGTLSQNTLSAINLLLVVTSIFILVLSNIEAGKNYALRSHVMLKCAQQISELYNEVEFLIKTGSITPEGFNSHIKHYDKIIADFSDNHDDIDYLCLQIAHWKHFKLSGFAAYRKTLTRRVHRFMNIWGYYLAMLLPPPILFALVMGKAPAWLQ